MMKRLRAEDDDVEVAAGSQSKRARCSGGSVSSSFEKQLAYIESVKRADRSGLFYPKFALLLQDFRARRIDVDSLTPEIKKLFAGNRNLILGFNLFLPDWCKISLDDEDDEKTESEPETDENDEKEEKEDWKFKSVKFESHHATLPVHKGCYVPEKEIKTRLYKQGLNLCNKVERVLCVSDYQDFLKILYNYSSEKITRDDLKAAVTHVLGSDGDLVEEFNKFIKDPEEHLSSKLEGKMQVPRQTKSVSKPKKINPSYSRLPGKTQRSKKIVLNDEFVCASVGDQNYSSKQRHIHQHEIIMFECEDDRYEMDMLTECIQSAIEKVKNLVNAIKEKEINIEIGFKVEDNLSIHHRRCIERLYGDYGLEILDVLQKEPIKALPVILYRLEQKQQELAEYREGFNELCTHIYAKIKFSSNDRGRAGNILSWNVVMFQVQRTSISFAWRPHQAMRASGINAI